jgi:hypothetical protein
MVLVTTGLICTMAEAVVFAGTILSFIPALYRLKEIADALRTCTQYDQDPRVNTIHALFVAQQVRAVDWANQNGVNLLK